MIEKRQDTTRNNVRAVVMNRFGEIVMVRTAVSLSLAAILVAGLLLNVVAKEILDDPQVVHNLAQSGPSAQQIWNAFSSENRRISSTHGGPRVPVPR